MPFFSKFFYFLFFISRCILCHNGTGNSVDVKIAEEEAFDKHVEPQVRMMTRKYINCLHNFSHTELP